MKIVKNSFLKLLKDSSKYARYYVFIYLHQLIFLIDFDRLIELYEI